MKILQAFLKQYFYKQRHAEIGKKNQAKAKQLLEAELLLSENSTHSSYENNRTYSSVCIH